MFHQRKDPLYAEDGRSDDQPKVFALVFSTHKGKFPLGKLYKVELPQPSSLRISPRSCTNAVGLVSRVEQQ